MSLLEAHNIVVERLAQRVLDSVDFSLNAGEIVGVVGPNGAGKTTLLRALIGLQKTDSGDVLFQGKPLDEFSHSHIAKHIGYLPQHAVFHWPITVERAVSLGRFPHLAPLARSTLEDHSAIARAMEIAEVNDLRERRVDQISGGECMRVHLARVLAGEHLGIIADEPTTSLDPKYQLHFLSVLEQQAARGSAIVISLHDLSLASRFCHRVVVLQNGRAVVVDTPERALNDTTLANVFEVRAERLSTTKGTSIVPTELLVSSNSGSDENQ
jgi:iron complex transport system ATP-binding protein